VTWRSGSVSGGGLLVTSTNEGAMQLDLGKSLQRQTVGCCDVASNCLISFFDDAFSYFDGFTSDMASDAQATGAGSVTLLHGGLHFTGPRWAQGTRRLVFRVPLEQWNSAHYFTKAYVAEDMELVVVIDQDGSAQSLRIKMPADGFPHPSNKLVVALAGQGPKVEVEGPVPFGGSLLAPQRDVHLLQGSSVRGVLVAADLHQYKSSRVLHQECSPGCIATPWRVPNNATETTLYVFAGDEARLRPDFLAVIEFDELSRDYGKVVLTVPLPPPGNIGNEPHHCGLVTENRNILACGGLLSLLSDQDGIFFFDVSEPRRPRFLSSTRARHSSITDDFLPLPSGGFLVTQMGSATGGAPGRLAEFDRCLRLVAEHPRKPLPADDPGFNPHGVSAHFDLNMLVTSDYVNPVSTLNAYAGGVELRGTIRFWDLERREISSTVVMPGPPMGIMDVKFIPHDPHGIAVAGAMFSGVYYTVDPTTGSVTEAYNCRQIVPQLGEPSQCMVHLLTPMNSGDRLLASSSYGQVLLLDISNRARFHQLSVVNLGVTAGPHVLALTHDQERLVVADYFLNQDDFGRVHVDGDHKMHVLKVSRDSLSLDPRFTLDFDEAFDHSARPHGFAMK
jgi:selenium-binding protein 1